MTEGVEVNNHVFKCLNNEDMCGEETKEKKAEKKYNNIIKFSSNYNQQQGRGERVKSERESEVGET